MQPYEHIAIETDAHGVRILRLNRPDRLNAFNRRMIAEWADAVETAHADPACKAVVLTGAGRAFCAGGDADEMAEIEAADNVERKDYLWRGIHRVPLAMARIDKPVIAAVNGTARGAGMDMALMCDLRIAAAGATFAESYIGMGLVSGDGGIWYLPRLIGMPRALELLWTGRVVDAAEAERIGLVNRVVPDAEVLDAAVALAREIAAQPQEAIRLTKRAAHQAAVATLEAHLDMVSSHMAVLYDTEGFRGRLRAFLERRAKPAK